MLVEVGPFGAFGGELPRLAPEHLPAGGVTGALRALDCKLYSGDLIPVAQSRSGPHAGLDAPTEILGLYGASGSDVSDIRWLAWDGASVDTVVAPSEAADAEDRRVYWTDGVAPRWTTYADAGARQPRSLRSSRGLFIRPRPRPPPSVPDRDAPPIPDVHPPATSLAAACARWPAPDPHPPPPSPTGTPTAGGSRYRLCR